MCDADADAEMIMGRERWKKKKKMGRGFGIWDLGWLDGSISSGMYLLPDCPFVSLRLAEAAEVYLLRRVAGVGMLCRGGVVVGWFLSSSVRDGVEGKERGHLLSLTLAWLFF